MDLPITANGVSMPKMVGVYIKTNQVAIDMLDHGNKTKETDTVVKSLPLLYTREISWETKKKDLAF
jgi:hypothetical protein